MSAATPPVLRSDASPATARLTPDTPVTPREMRPSGLDADIVAGLRNASKLGLSLMGTWGVALVVRVMLPRQLGPASFGAFQFADAFSSAVFVLATLGIETYVRKEVAIRREHAAEFYGGVLVLRLVLCTLLVIAAVAALTLAGKPPLVLRLVLVLASMQFFVMQNATYAALLHAVGKVDGLSVLNVASKLIWGGGALVGLLSGGGVVSVAIAMLASEALKMAGLEVLVRRHFSLRPRIDVRATMHVLVGSMPFFATGLSQALAGKINVSLMSFLASDTEIGWFGAASTIAGIALLLSPLLGWVLLPLTARAESRSSEELTRLTRRAMLLVLTVAVPITLMLGLSADVIVHTLFGSAFGPATLSLRVLAPTFVLTYIGIVSSGALIGQGRSWTVTVILLSGLVLSPLMNWLLIPRTLAMLGAGGAGVGAGLALNVTEAFNAIALTIALKNQAFDRRTRATLAKMMAACVVVIAVDRFALSAYGIPRLIADAVLYASLVTWWKAGDHMGLVRILIQTLRRKTHHATAV